MIYLGRLTKERKTLARGEMIKKVSPRHVRNFSLMGKLRDMGRQTKSFNLRKQSNLPNLCCSSPVFVSLITPLSLVQTFQSLLSLPYLFSSNYEFTKALTIKHLCINCWCCKSQFEGFKMLLSQRREDRKG